MQYAVFAVGGFIYYGPDNFGAFANPDSAEQLVSDRRQFCLMLGHDGGIPCNMDCRTAQDISVVFIFRPSSSKFKPAQAEKSDSLLFEPAKTNV